MSINTQIVSLFRLPFLPKGTEVSTATTASSFVVEGRLLMCRNPSSDAFRTLC